jgi:hypothetical protein
VISTSQIDVEDTMRTTGKIGLGLAGLLALGDVALPLISDGEFPPMAVALIALAFGVATLAALVPAWRGSRVAGWTVVVTRLISMTGALPAFFVSDVPVPAVALAGTGVLLTLACAVLFVPELLTRRAVEVAR